MIDTKIYRKSINPIKEIKLYNKYKSIIKNERPDIVLTYTVKPGIYGSIISKKEKIRCISNVTGLSSSIYNGGLLSKVVLFLYKTAFRDNSCVFFQNQSDLNFFKSNKIVSENARLLNGSGVNLKEFEYIDFPAENNQIAFLFVGRICKEKGFREFIECAKFIKEKHKNVTFDVIGEIEDKQFENLIKSSVNDGIITYYGLRFDVKNFFSSHHAVILPSYHEGMSNVLLECLACGRPVIASNISGCKETFDENVSGLSFEPKSVEDLIRAVEKFIALPYLSKKNMGIEGRKKVELYFDRDEIIRQYYNEIFKKIIY